MSTSYCTFCPSLADCFPDVCRHEEEGGYFALYNGKLDTAFVHDEHEAFQVGMNAFESYLVSCLPPNTEYGFGKHSPAGQVPIPFDGAKARTLIEGFATPLADHVCGSLRDPSPTGGC